MAWLCTPTAASSTTPACQMSTGGLRELNTGSSMPSLCFTLRLPFQSCLVVRSSRRLMPGQLGFVGTKIKDHLFNVLESHGKGFILGSASVANIHRNGPRQRAFPP